MMRLIPLIFLLRATAFAERPPNIIMIFTDDQGYADVGCFGAENIKTPRLDAMAAEGLRLTSFYSASPICSPSRAALMTGCYPPRVGMGLYPSSSQKRPELTAQVLFPYHTVGLNRDEVTMAEVLKARGYATACIGKWHLGHQPEFLPTEQGFDSYLGIPYSNDMVPTPLLRDKETIEEPVDQDPLTERYTAAAIEFIESQKDAPFFLYLAHAMPHVPLHVSDRFRDKSAGGFYGDVIEMLDWSTGEILDTIKRLGIEQDTLVVFTSDNGPWLSQGEHGGHAKPLRAGKGTTYEGGMREPCIAWWPGHIPAGTATDAVAGTIDLLPTFAALAGATLPDRTLDGRDLSNLLLHPDAAETPHEAYYYFKGLGLEAVRSGDWKLVFKRQQWEEYPYRRNLPPEPDAWVETALYDLSADIGEATDVSAAHPEVVARLEAMAQGMREDLGDSRTETVCANCRPLGGTTPE
ncbi:MAG: sulfatase-like hydrolase/transferase [Candidatus Hydrogenedens sp.]|nr:sulfatase-like hydrolase/transferase [Candidatus Hydrogenedens sp.]